MIKEVAIIITMFILVISCTSSQKQNEVSTMKLTSPAFAYNELIPSTYTCDGDNINPPLVISDVPMNAKSLALIIEDPDIPDAAKKNFNVDIWAHWVVFNIKPVAQSISEATKSIGTVGKNTRGNISYGGPCPPDKEHRYFFKLYALDILLPLKEGASKTEVEQAMQNHIIEQTELMGRYKRK